MSKSIEIHPITVSAAMEVASNLRNDDYREVSEGYGLDPIIHIPTFSMKPNSVYFKMPNGKTAGLAGVENNGMVWMLCTPIINDYPIAFARGSKRFIESRPEKLLWNIVDKRNIAHIKLLRFLGFKFLREVLHGPNLLTFIEFCKINYGNRI